MLEMSEYEDKWIHIDDIPDHEFGTDLMKNLIFAIFEDGDVDHILNAVEDLSGYFDLAIPYATPLLKFKDKP